MSIELPAVSAIIARLPNYEINLAAYSGIVFPLALIIEAPIIMLLPASTALSQDWASYAKLRRFMMTTSALLTALHALVVFTPLYFFVAEKIIGATAATSIPARLGMIIMIPWTWSIAYRRFNQGVMIRFGHSRIVSTGTVIRLSANLVVLLCGYQIGTVPGIVVAASAVVTGVMSEAIYAGLAVRPVIANELRMAAPVASLLTLRSFLEFYVPLALTSLLFLFVQPLGSAALYRMPQPIESIDAWAVVSGLVFLFRSPGIAYNEVVVALLGLPGSAHKLRGFAHLLAGLSAALLLLMTATPLAQLWFRNLLGISQDLTRLAISGLWLCLYWPSLSVFQSWYQGSILHSRHTRGITEAVLLFLGMSAVILFLGVIWGRVAGLYTNLIAFGVASIGQTLWLYYRSRQATAAAERREAAMLPAAGITQH